MTDHKHHLSASIFLTALLWIVSAFVFGGSGMWVQLGSTGLQTAGLLANAGNADFASSATQAQGLLYTLVTFVINLIIYFIISVIIMIVFNMFLGKKK